MFPPPFGALISLRDNVNHKIKNTLLVLVFSFLVRKVIDND